MRARWLVYMLLALFSAAVVAGAVFVTWSDYSTTVEEVERGARAAAQAYAVHADRNLGELRLGIDWLARNVDPQALKYRLDPTTAETARRIAKQLPGLSALLVVGADARVKFSTAENAAIGADVSEREYFNAARDRGESNFIGPAYYDKGTERVVYTLSRRLERNGRFAGLAVASAWAAAWNEIVAPLVPMPGTIVRLLRADGGIVVAQRSNPADGRLEIAMEGPAIAASVGDAFVERVPTAGYRLVAEVAVPRDAALARWRARRTRIMSGAVLGLIALSVFGFLAQRLLRREAVAVETAAQRTLELEASTAELRRALESEKLLMAELEHRVKNSLSLAAGMLALQKSQASESGTRSILDSAHARILAIARVHERLCDSSSPSTVAFDSYLRGLCADLATHAGFRYVVDANTILVPSSQAVTLGLIVTELLLNAAKHGATPSGVRVDVTAKATADGLGLTIRDYGQGLPATFDASESTGLGMRIVLNLTSQLGAKLMAKTSDPGTCWTIRVPLERPHNRSGGAFGRAGNDGK